MEDIAAVVGEHYHRQDSIVIMGKHGKSRCIYYYDTIPPECFCTTYNLMQQMDDAGESIINLRISFESDRITAMDAERRLIKLSKLEIQNKKTGETEECVQIAMFAIKGIKVCRNRAELDLYKEQIFCYAVSLDTGMFYFKNANSPRIMGPLKFTDYFEWKLYSDREYRTVFIKLLRLFGQDKYILRDMADSIEKDKVLGARISMEQVLKAHNKNQLLREILGETAPINFNSLSILEGILVSSMFPLVRESERPFFMQLIKSDVLRKTMDEHGVCFLGDREGEEFAIVFSYVYYQSIGVLTDTQLNRQIYLDYLKMCFKLGKKVSFRFRSINRIIREHDNLVIEMMEKGIEKEPNKCIIAKDSDFLKLREGLPSEFEWITTSRKLFYEGGRQHNCVYSYMEKIERDACAIYHWEHEGRHYTIEFEKHTEDRRWANEVNKQTKRFVLSQMLRKYNEPALAEDIKIVEDSL